MEQSTRHGTVHLVGETSASLRQNSKDHVLSSSSWDLEPHIVAASLHSFLYPPLSTSSRQIRLLKILPGPLYDPLVCELFAVPFNADLDYVAISYTRGNDTPLCDVQINGSCFQVRENCFYALRQVRYFKKEDGLV